MSLDWDGIRNQVYECARCHYRFKGEECIMRDRLVCPQCSYKVLIKIKPPIVKRVKAI